MRYRLPGCLLTLLALCQYTTEWHRCKYRLGTSGEYQIPELKPYPTHDDNLQSFVQRQTTGRERQGATEGGEGWSRNKRNKRRRKKRNRVARCPRALQFTLVSLNTVFIESFSHHGQQQQRQWHHHHRQPAYWNVLYAQKTISNSIGSSSSSRTLAELRPGPGLHKHQRASIQQHMNKKKER